MRPACYHTNNVGLCDPCFQERVLNALQAIQDEKFTEKGRLLNAQETEPSNQGAEASSQAPNSPQGAGQDRRDPVRTGAGGRLEELHEEQRVGSAGDGANHSGNAVTSKDKPLRTFNTTPEAEMACGGITDDQGESTQTAVQVATAFAEQWIEDWNDVPNQRFNRAVREALIGRVAALLMAQAAQAPTATYADGMEAAAKLCDTQATYYLSPERIQGARDCAGTIRAAARDTAPADSSADERAFWASKFEHWAKCQESGGTWAIRKADGFRECAKVLRENDRWVPHGVETTRPVLSEGDK